MADNTTTSLSNQFRRHYSDVLLATANDEIVMNQFAKKAILDKKIGATTARFFRRVAASAANVQDLVEGTPISTFTSLTYTPVDVDLAQIGEAMRYTDVATYTALLQILEDGVKLMGEDCALKADDVTLGKLALASGGGTKKYGSGLADWAALAAATDANGKFLALDALKAVTTLKVNKAPKIGGYYIGVVGAQVSADIRQDTRWLDPQKYAARRELFRGEIGELDGVRYVETTNCWMEDAAGAEGTRVTTGQEIYLSVITGREAYGVTELAGEGPTRPEIVICNTADKSDPLNQLLTAGWKAMYQAFVCNAAWVIALRSRATIAG